MAADKIAPVGAAPALVDSLMRKAFEQPRAPRSEAYMLGVRELLNCKARNIRLVCPYRMGTTEADAFYAGTDEGHCIWLAHMDARQPGGDGA